MNTPLAPDHPTSRTLRPFAALRKAAACGSAALLPILLMLATAACVPRAVVALGETADGNREVRATSAEAEPAQRAAQQAAERACAGEGQVARILSLRTEDRGIYGDALSRKMGQVSEVIRSADEDATPTLASSEDFLVTLVFRCEAR